MNMSRTPLVNDPFFIVGCPRSGTTLLQRMLDAHPDVAVAPETFFMRRFWDRRAEYGDLAEEGSLDRLVDDLAATPEFEEMGLDVESFRAGMHTRSRRWDAVFHELLRQFAETQKAKRVGEKTPNHVLYISILHRWFPEAKFVHLVRDPRAVVNSWRTIPWSSGYRWRDAEVWVEYVRAGREAESSHGDHVTSFHFEDLVRSPEEELRALCSFLEMPYDDRMRSFHERDPSTVDVQREPWKQRTIDPIDASVADRWRDELSAGAQAQVEAVAEPEMRQWGYQKEVPFLRRREAELRVWIGRPLWKLGLLIEDIQGNEEQNDASLSGASKRCAVGFLHVGHSEHGVTRYGRVLAEGAQKHLDDVEVHEAAIDWAEDPGRHATQIEEAVHALRRADVVHVQYNERVWGESLRALVNVYRFVRRCSAPIVVTVHDVRDGYGLRAILHRLQERSTALSALLSGQEESSGSEGKRREAAPGKSSKWAGSLVRSIQKGIRYVVQEVSNSLATICLAQYASRVLVCTAEEARRLQGVVDRDQRTVIPHFVEERPRHVGREEAKQMLDLDDLRVLGMLGFVHRRKGYDLAVEALSHLPDDVILVCIGRPALQSVDYADDLRRRAAALGAEDRLRITGYVPEDELDHYLAATDLALCPFRRASASGSLATWIAAERPILASDLPLFGEYNERVPGAIATFAPYTPEALTHRAMDLLERSKFEIQPRLRVLRESHALPEVMQQHLGVYQQAVKESAGKVSRSCG